MINLTNLYEFITNLISDKSVILYFGVGTNFYYSTDTFNKHEWNISKNQQFPSFLQDAKIKYFEKFFNNELYKLIHIFSLSVSKLIFKYKNNGYVEPFGSSVTHAHLLIVLKTSSIFNACAPVFIFSHLTIGTAFESY